MYKQRFVAKVYNTQNIQSFGKSNIKEGKRLLFADLKPEFNGGIAKGLSGAMIGFFGLYILKL